MGVPGEARGEVSRNRHCPLKQPRGLARAFYVSRAPLHKMGDLNPRVYPEPQLGPRTATSTIEICMGGNENQFNKP